MTILFHRFLWPGGPGPQQPQITVLTGDHSKSGAGVQRDRYDLPIGSSASNAVGFCLNEEAIGIPAPEFEWSPNAEARQATNAMAIVRSSTGGVDDTAAGWRAQRLDPLLPAS